MGSVILDVAIVVLIAMVVLWLVNQRTDVGGWIFVATKGAGQ